MTDPIWTPGLPRQATAGLTAFTRVLEQQWRVQLPDYAALHAFSVDEAEKFWRSFTEFADLRAASWGDRTLVTGSRMQDARFFPEARLNFAENLLRRRDGADAIVFQCENGPRRRISWRQLYDTVSRLAQALRAEGVKPGDRIAGFLPNMPEAVMAMLAAASVGAVWTSCSPDFGIGGVLDRFGQTGPVLLFTADGYLYKGKPQDSLRRVREIVSELESVRRVVIIPFLDAEPEADDILDAVTFDEFIADYKPRDIAFEQLPFDHPLYIMYSSGTTGKPKCIIHRAGGVLLTQRKEHLLHLDIRRGDRVFFFTTCGWMMWNWLVAALAGEASLMLYDGSPFHPNGNVLFDYARDEGWTFFGTSAKYLDGLEKAGIRPARTHDLPQLRTLASTGSPLAPERFDYIHRDIKKDIHVASISGGTDILGCFVLGAPALPVWRGEIQAAGLGMRVEALDESGAPVKTGEKGELTCASPFPSMPLGFWNDPDGSRYHAAYFAKYPGRWNHGDFISRTRQGGYVIHGRADATLNPGGVRIGTAEIYNQVESFPQVEEALAIGQEWGDDTRILLFVRLKAGIRLDDDLKGAIRTRIRQHCTARHVPAKIIAVADIPRTRSGKITELAVRDVVHGRPVGNREALANPQALDLFKNLAELQTD